MNQLAQWKHETGHTMREMGRMLQVSPSHICRVMHGQKTLGESRCGRLKEIRRLEELIKTSSHDRWMLEYELDKFIKGEPMYGNNK